MVWSQRTSRANVQWACLLEQDTPSSARTIIERSATNSRVGCSITRYLTELILPLCQIRFVGVNGVNADMLYLFRLLFTVQHLLETDRTSAPELRTDKLTTRGQCMGGCPVHSHLPPPDIHIPRPTFPYKITTTEYDVTRVNSSSPFNADGQRLLLFCEWISRE